MRSGRSAVVALLGCTLALCSACVGAEAGEELPPQSDPFVLFPPHPEEPVPLPPELEPLPEEMGQLPLVPEEMSALLEEVHARWGADPDFGSPEISLDRTVLILRWHGPPPAELLALVDAHAGADFQVRLDPTLFPSGELGDEAGRLVREHPGVVTSAWPRTEGDGVGVGLEPSLAGDADAAALARLEVTSRFPLFPESLAAPVPAAG